MSLEVVSEKTSVDRSGYGQVQEELGKATNSSTKDSTQSQTSRNDRNLIASSSSSRVSANKSHIAFNLKFVIKIANRTPFNPSANC